MSVALPTLPAPSAWWLCWWHLPAEIGGLWADDRDSLGPHLGGSLWSHKLDTQMAPVARAPQDPNLPAKCVCFERKGKAGKVGYRAYTCRKQKREESSILVAGIPLVTSNLSWKFCCLKLQPWPSAQHPSDYPTQSILSVLLEVLVSCSGYPECVPVVPWERKGQSHFPAGWSQQEKMQFISLGTAESSLHWCKDCFLS